MSSVRTGPECAVEVKGQIRQHVNQQVSLPNSQPDDRKPEMMLLKTSCLGLRNGNLLELDLDTKGRRVLHFLNIQHFPTLPMHSNLNRTQTCCTLIFLNKPNWFVIKKGRKERKKKCLIYRIRQEVGLGNLPKASK